MQYVYSFRESNRDMIDLLGSKSINLSEMINLDLPVPNGFTISVDACQEYYKNGNKIASEVEFQMLSKLKALEKDSGKKFGSKDNPLLISIRSSLPSSASSAMCSILNLGMTQEIVEEMAKNNPRMAYDTYRRFISEYATIVKRYPDEYFNGYLENYKKSKGYKSDLDLKVDDFKLIIQKYKDNYLECGGSYFSNNPKEQLMSAIETVFLACNNDKVLDNNVAIVIQEMVYGNMNNNSGSGVLYTHNLINGEKILNCEFLLNTQGPDIILNKNNTLKIEFLKKNAPKIYEELINASKKLEIYYKDALEISFTIEDGKLFLLQAKKARRASVSELPLIY